MSHKLVFRRAAQGEFDQAVDWYEEKQPGLGKDFFIEINRTLDSVADHPERFAKVYSDFRLALVDRFPYAIYFRIQENDIVILSVIHTSRNPVIWQRRI